MGLVYKINSVTKNGSNLVIDDLLTNETNTASFEIIDSYVNKPIKNSLNEFHNRVSQVIKERKHVVKPLSFMVLSTAMEIAIVYTSFLAVGAIINPGKVVLAFAAANLVGVISIIPGDVGVHEIAMIFVMSLFGVDGAVAISATLLYRVFNKMIFLPLGFFFYTKLLKPAEAGRLV